MRFRRAPEGVAAEFADASRPSDQTPWRDARWCALDLGTTFEQSIPGLIADHLASLGAVEIDRREYFERLTAALETTGIGALGARSDLLPNLD